MKHLLWVGLFCIFLALSSCAWAQNWQTINFYSSSCHDNQFSADMFPTFKGNFGNIHCTWGPFDIHGDNYQCSSNDLMIRDDGCAPPGCCCSEWAIVSANIQVNDSCTQKNPATPGYYFRLVCG
jgi:hypothetical protein